VRASSRVIFMAALSCLFACGGKTALASLAHEPRPAAVRDRPAPPHMAEDERDDDGDESPPHERDAAAEGEPESWQPGDGDWVVRGDAASDELAPGDDGGPGDPGVVTHACRSAAQVNGEQVVTCTEWHGPSASELLTLCSAPDTTYLAHECDRAGAVGVCSFPENMGLVIRLVLFAHAEEQASACREAGGFWSVP
jgi:hypothetical protein